MVLIGLRTGPAYSSACGGDSLKVPMSITDTGFELHYDPLMVRSTHVLDTITHLIGLCYDYIG